MQEVGLAEARIAIYVERVVRAARRLCDRLRSGVSQAVRGGGHEGLEAVPGIETHRRGLASPTDNGLVPAPVPGHRGGLARCVRRGNGWRHLVQHLKPDLDGLTGDRSQCSLDQRDKSALDPLPDRRVRDPEDEHPVMTRICDGDGFDTRKPHLPRRLRNLLTKRRGAARPQPITLFHLLLRTPPGETVHNVVHRCGTQAATWSFERTPLRPQRLVAIRESRLALKDTIPSARPSTRRAGSGIPGRWRCAVGGPGKAYRT